MKITHLLATIAIIAGCALLLTPASANAATKWHNGTPKAIRGNWYHNGSNKAYLTYTATKSIGNVFDKSDADNTYYRETGYGLKNIKYKQLSKRVYELTGIQYSPKGSKVQFDGQRMTYKVMAVSKTQLHFYKGGYLKYTSKPTFKVVTSNHKFTD